MSHYVTLKFTQPHINYVLVETWEAFKLSSTTISQRYFEKTNLPTIYPPDICTNHQYLLAGTPIYNIERENEIGNTENASIAPIYM